MCSRCARKYRAKRMKVLGRNVEQLHILDTGLYAETGVRREDVRGLGELAAGGLSALLRENLFRYHDVIVTTQRLDYLRAPFNKALMIRLMARRKAVIRDQRGASVEINVGLLLRWGIRKLRGALAKRKEIDRCLSELSVLEAELPRDGALPGVAAPVYLRTDLVFGLRSGGSVGHIAGVLNQLHARFPGTRLLSTDVIPTVDDDVPVHLFEPSPLLADFPESRQLASGWHFADWAVQQIGADRPRFLYHRFGLNNLSGVLVARRLGVPLVLEFNGSEVWASRHWGKSLCDEYTALRMERACLRHADLVVAVSEPLRAQLLAAGVPEASVLVMPNGVDPDRFHPAVQGGLVRARYGLVGRRVIGFIGTFGKWHGAEVLVHAYAALLARRPELRGSISLMMIGDGETMPTVRTLVARYGLEDAVHLPGLVPQEQGPAHLAACDILVAPHVPNPDGSPFFGSPTKIFEYMAMGKGIVASDLDQIGEILEHGRTAWLATPGDAGSLVQGMLSLLDDQALAASLGASARRQVLAEHTWERYTQRILDSVESRFGTAASVEGGGHRAPQ